MQTKGTLEELSIFQQLAKVFAVIESGMTRPQPPEISPRKDPTFTR